ncbi:MAG: PAS domain-containing protein [Gammaproteobacteria bacterium]
MDESDNKSAPNQDAKSQLPESERLELLEMAASLVLVGHWRLDLVNDSLFWSEEIYRIHGVDPNDYTPDLKSALDFYHPEDAARVAGLVEAAIAEQKPFEFEFRIVRPDDEVRYVQARGRVTTDGDGAVTNVFGVFQDVTDRIRTEDELREVRLRLDLAVRGSSTGLWYWNVETSELYWSPRFMEMIEVSPEDFTPSFEEFCERLHPNDKAPVLDALEQHLESRTPFSVEYRLRCNSGQYLWIQARGQAEWDDAGKPLRMAGSVEDISLRKREETFRDHIYNSFTSPGAGMEAKITDILNLSRLYLNLDRAAVYAAVEDGYEMTFAQDAQAPLDINVNNTPAAAHLPTIMKSHGVVTHNHLADEDTATADLHFIAMPLQVDRKRYGILWFASDATTKRVFTTAETSMVPVIERLLSYELFQQNALEDAARQRAELDRILNGVPLRIWYKDDKNGIVRLNNEAARAMNMSVEEAEGANTYDLFPEMAAKYHEDDLRVINSGKAEMGIVEKFTPLDGPSGWISTDKIPFKDLETNEPRLLVVSQDITEVMSAQESLQKQAEELQQSNHDLDQFAYIASHDLRAPMRGVDQLAEWIEDDLGEDVDEGIRKKLSMMRKRVARLDRMLTDMLMFARAGKREETQAPIDVDSVFEEVIGWIEQRGQIEVIAHPSSLQLKMSRTQLQQLTTNLISNAIKHHDRESGTIEVSAQRRGADVVIAVRDDGPGIAEKYQQRVFEMFSTLQSRDEREGSGIGLAVVARLCRAHDGRVALISPLANERGTEFQVILPGTLIA